MARRSKHGVPERRRQDTRRDQDVLTDHDYELVLLNVIHLSGGSLLLAKVKMRVVTLAARRLGAMYINTPTASTGTEVPVGYKYHTVGARAVTLQNSSLQKL